VRAIAHASVILLDVAEPWLTGRFAVPLRLSADGIAMPMRGLNTQRPFAETDESHLGQTCRPLASIAETRNARVPPCVAGVPATRCEADATSRNPRAQDPYVYPDGGVCPHPIAAHGLTFNGSAEYATALGGTRKRSDRALKNLRG
jgi:hypothetical protein